MAKKATGKKKSKRQNRGSSTPKKKSPAKKPSKTKARSTKAARPYPPWTLEEAVVIPQAIRDKNNGNPWQTDDVAAACQLARMANPFFYLAAASRDYGLTIGSRDTDKISLSELGRSIVFAGDDETRKAKLREAFFGIDFFEKVFAHYGGSKLPEKTFLSNVLLSEFKLDPSLHDEFAKTFKANCKFLGIEKGLGKDEIPKRKDEVEHPSEIRVVGEAKGKFDRSAFVIMPFTEKGDKPRPSGFFGEVLNSLITPAANQAGFSVETAEQDGSDVIQSTIINRLLNADLVVADLTDHNPNVLFELGIRIMKKLPVALIKAEGTGRILM